MAISTYYEPPPSLAISDWAPLAQDKDEDSFEDFVTETAPWLEKGKKRRQYYGLSLDQRPDDATKPSLRELLKPTETGAVPLLDYHPTQGTKDWKELFAAPEDPRTEEQKKTMEEMQEGQARAVAEGAVKGGIKGLPGGFGGVAAGAAVGALGASEEHHMEYLQGKYEEQEEESLERQLADYARLQQEMAARNAMLAGAGNTLQPTTYAADQYFAEQYGGEPTDYDSWTKAVFG